MIGKWFPTTEKASANSLASTGGSVGGLLAIGLGPMLAVAIGWRATLVGLGLVSMLFSVAWALYVAEGPSPATVPAPELAYLRAHGVATETVLPQKTKPAIPWHLLRSPAVLATCYAHMVFNFGRYFLYGWIPTYYVNTIGTSAYFAGACMTSLQVADACIKLVTGPLADKAVASGRVSLLSLRKGMSCVGFAGFGLFVAFCGMTKDPIVITVLLSVAKACSSLHAAGFQTSYLDLSVRDTGALCGIGNTLATIASTISPLIAGYVIEQYSWNLMFQIVFAVNMSGVVVFGMLASTACLDSSESSMKKSH